GGARGGGRGGGAGGGGRGPPGGRGGGAQRGGAQGGARDARGLGHEQRRARHSRDGGEQQRPQRRGGSSDWHARVVRESSAFGEVAREVQVDPRVVERKAGGAGDPPLAGQEDRQRQRRGEEDEDVVATLSGHARACSWHTRSDGDPPAAYTGRE